MKNALLIVDVQNDFVENGSLAINGGVLLAKKIYKYYLNNKNHYNYIFLSRDWHKKNAKHFEKWPKHCIENTKGAAFVKPINKINGTIISKGQNNDGYSVFSNPEFLQILKQKNIKILDICVIATDYCVKETVLDSVKNIKNTNLLLDLCIGVSNKTSKAAVNELKTTGVNFKKVT